MTSFHLKLRLENHFCPTSFTQGYTAILIRSSFICEKIYKKGVYVFAKDVENKDRAMDQ
jgi:hypothetical protein